MSPIISGGGGGGGSSISTATATVTANQGNGYVTSHTFDLGSAGPHPVLITLTGLTLTGDGETFGNAPGTLYVGPTSADPVQPGPHTDVDISADGVVFGKAFEIAVGPQTAGDGVSPTLEIQTTSVQAGAVCTSGRYLKVPIAIVENSTGAVYAGANHPSAQIRIDLRYL
jgi:hypothetical protein